MRKVFWAILVTFLLFRAQGVSAATTGLFCGTSGISTQIGCIEAGSTEAFIKKLFELGTGIAGGIAFLLIIFGGFQILTSTGNPERLNAGKELVGSAISGLLLILFSVFLLKIIGVDILCIPGFGSC